jgi:hypothetical protein
MAPTRRKRRWAQAPGYDLESLAVNADPMSHADRRFGRRGARPLGKMSVKLAGDGQEAFDAHIQTEVSSEEAAEAGLGVARP